MANHSDTEVRELLLSQGEIGALKKAIMYLKFSCEETESLLYAGSPLINSVLKKLLDIDDLGMQAKEFYEKQHEPNELFILSKIDRLEKEMGKVIDGAMKQEAFKECIFPFPSRNKMTPGFKP